MPTRGGITDETVKPDALFDVGSVAVIGASPGKYYPASVIANLQRYGMTEDQLYAVNPKHSVIEGLKSLPDLKSLPNVPSLAVIVVGASRAADALEEAAAIGTHAALVIADGYSEIGAVGKERQRSLGKIALANGIALLGPNSLGYVVPSRNLAAWVGGPVPEPGSSSKSGRSGHRLSDLVS